MGNKEEAMTEQSTGPTSLTRFKDLLRMPPILHPSKKDDEQYSLRIQMHPARVQLHSELPPIEVWAYAGSLPGPTIEVSHGQRLQVEWINAIPADEPYPITAPDGTQHERGSPINGHIKQIGTDGGLLGRPAELPADGIVLAPAERADLIVDFRAMPRQRLTLVN